MDIKSQCKLEKKYKKTVDIVHEGTSMLAVHLTKRKQSLTMHLWTAICVILSTSLSIAGNYYKSYFKDINILSKASCSGKLALEI